MRKLSPAAERCDFPCGIILGVHTFLFKLMKRNVVREKKTRGHTLRLTAGFPRRRFLATFLHAVAHLSAGAQVCAN